MSRSIILTLLLFSLISVKAQDDRFYAGFRYGFSLPMGQFASHDYGYGAYALLGTSFTAEGSARLYKGFGLGAEVSFAYYPIASGYYLEDMQMDTTDPSYYPIYLKAEPYEVRNYMIGATYRYDLSPKFLVSVKGMGGICWARSPYQFITGQYMIGTLFHIITPAISSKPAFMIGASINYRLFPHVQLLLESEYSYAESKFTFWKDGGTRAEVQSLKMPFFKIQPGLNITF